MLLFVVMFCVIVALGFGLASAWGDIKGFTISNAYPVGVIVTFVPAFLTATLLVPEAGYFASWQSHLLAAAAMFAGTFILFTLRLIGAGDSKLCTAYALWLGLPGLPAFLFFMTVIGGLLGLLTLALRRFKPFEVSAGAQDWIASAQAGGSDVPYGVAIFAGAVLAFVQSGYFDPDKLAALIQGAAQAASL